MPTHSHTPHDPARHTQAEPATTFKQDPDDGEGQSAGFSASGEHAAAVAAAQARAQAQALAQHQQDVLAQQRAAAAHAQQLAAQAHHHAAGSAAHRNVQFEESTAKVLATLTTYCPEVGPPNSDIPAHPHPSAKESHKLKCNSRSLTHSHREACLFSLFVAGCVVQHTHTHTHTHTRTHTHTHTHTHLKRRECCRTANKCFRSWQSSSHGLSSRGRTSTTNSCVM
jgi:hypothetical protein